MKKLTDESKPRKKPTKDSAEEALIKKGSDMLKHGRRKRRLLKERRSMGKPEKITDKMRLDWLTKEGQFLRLDTLYIEPIWTLDSYYNKTVFGKTPRQAIDAAIKAERDSRKGKG